MVEVLDIAIQGGVGSYHEQAARQYFGKQAQIQYCETFADVFAAVEQGETRYGVVASGNTIYGAITEVHDLLRRHARKVAAVADTGLTIHHCLIGLPGSHLQDITTVHSQHMALAQCERFLHETIPHAKWVEEADTAGSVALIKAQGNRAAAAVASRAAAKHHSMLILQENVEDYPGNYTRFLILEKAEAKVLGRSVRQPLQPASTH
jgi:prephenate dehydratase